jgi:hypothetical protein
LGSDKLKGNVLRGCEMAIVPKDKIRYFKAVKVRLTVIIGRFIFRKMDFKRLIFQ